MSTLVVTSSKLRDRVAWALCNWILKHVASEWYRRMIKGCIALGMESAARD